MGDGARIVITGDTHLGGGRVTDLALNNKIDSLFGEFLPVISSADLAISNLESPLIDQGNPILKTGPNLKSPESSVGVLKSAGFDLVTLANNHIMDYGDEGLATTLDACQKAGIETTGAGSSLEEARQPYFREINGIRLAVINIAENEFGTTQNGTPGCHPLDPVQNFYSIQKAKEESDKLIVIVHGGHEHYELPSPRMVETYRFFADAGADAVISHHTHCVSGYEMYKGIPIFYSLGNFLFDKPFDGTLLPWHTGIMVELNITMDSVKFNIHPFIQCAEKAGLRTLKSDEKLAFDSHLKELNNTILNNELLREQFELYCKRSNKLYSSYIEPHSVRLLHALRNRNMAPSFLSERKKRLILNLTRCEAHRDVLIQTLKT